MLFEAIVAGALLNSASSKKSSSKHSNNSNHNSKNYGGQTTADYMKELDRQIKQKKDMEKANRSCW